MSNKEGYTLEVNDTAELYECLRRISPTTLILEDFEDALVDVAQVSSHLYALVYDVDVVLSVLQRDLKIDYDEARVYFDTKLYTLMEKYGNPLFVKVFEVNEDEKSGDI